LLDSEDLLPEQVTSAVMDDLHIDGRDLRNVLDSVCDREARAGMGPNQLRAALVEAWQEYEAAKPRLAYTCGAEKFFGQMWRNKAGWPWKEGEAPKSQPTAPTQPVHNHRSNAISMDEVRRRAGIQ
jgi:hypothetical protein